MFVLRATQRLLARAKPALEAEPAESTTQLGNWCANPLHVGRRANSFSPSAHERSFPSLSRRRRLARSRARVQNAVRAGLCSLGIPSEFIEAELDEMHDVVWAKSASRRTQRTTGILVDFAKALPFYLEDGSSLDAVAAKLADTPINPLSPTTVFPDRATAALFAVDRGSADRLTTPSAGGTVIT